MAYFRTDKFGDKKLICTAKDRTKQKERFGWEGRRRPRDFDKTRAQEEIAHAYRCYNGSAIFDEMLEQEQENLQQQYRKLWATMRWVRGGAYSDEVSPTGSVEHVRKYLDDIQSRIRRYRWLLSGQPR
jgi:hypothetical protein